VLRTSRHGRRSPKSRVNGQPIENRLAQQMPSVPTPTLAFAGAGLKPRSPGSMRPRGSLTASSRRPSTTSRCFAVFMAASLVLLR
jgi:hypothetical protein